MWVPPRLACRSRSRAGHGERSILPSNIDELTLGWQDKQRDNKNRRRELHSEKSDTSMGINWMGTKRQAYLVIYSCTHPLVRPLVKSALRKLLHLWLWNWTRSVYSSHSSSIKPLVKIMCPARLAAITQCCMMCLLDGPKPKRSSDGPFSTPVSANRVHVSHVDAAGSSQ